MERLNYRLNNIKEKIDDFSGELEELCWKRPSRLNNVSITLNSLISPEFYKHESNYLDTPLETNHTFSRNDSINNIFRSEIERKDKKSNMKNLILETEPTKNNCRTLRTDQLNFTNNFCNFETHAETTHSEDKKRYYRGSSLSKSLYTSMEEDKLITENMEKIHILEEQIKEIYSIINDLRKQKFQKMNNNSMSNLNEVRPQNPSSIIQNKLIIEKLQSMLGGITIDEIIDKVKEIMYKQRKFLKQFYERLSEMYEKYSDSEINREINTEKVFNWIFYTVVKSHFYNNNNSNIGLNENEIYREICESLIKEYCLKDVYDLKRFIKDLIEKSKFNKKRVEKIKHILMKESKIRKAQIAN